MSFAPDSALVGAVRVSPNHDARAGGRAPDMLVLHYTGMADADEALVCLCDARARVSCHYFVFEDGRIVQLVPEARRAWHAGVSSWAGEGDVNSRSIGVEIANPGHAGGYPDFPEAQMAAVEALARDIVSRRHIAPARVLGHSDIAPARKNDPGEKFDWARLARAGVGLPPPSVYANENKTVLRPGDAGEAVARLQRALGGIGYALAAVGRYDEDTRLVVTAFQRHFRPQRVDGLADTATIAAIEDVKKRVNGVMDIDK